MKLFEIAPHYYSIFCDIDGVLSDFSKHVEDNLGIPDNEERQHDPTLRKVFWDKMVDFHERGGRFWEDLPLMDDAMDLWNFIKVYDPTIITATGGSIASAPAQKKVWLKKYFPGIPYIITTQPGEKGGKHGKKGRILIDDRCLEIEPWKKNGGIGILHKNAADTIKQLQDIFNANRIDK